MKEPARHAPGNGSRRLFNSLSDRISIYQVIRRMFSANLETNANNGDDSITSVDYLGRSHCFHGLRNSFFLASATRTL